MTRPQRAGSAQRRLEPESNKVSFIHLLACVSVDCIGGSWYVAPGRGRLRNDGGEEKCACVRGSTGSLPKLPRC